MIQQPNISALAPKSPYKKRTLKPAHIKYGGAVFAFFMMIAAIRVFLNYATIQSSIEHVVAERESIVQHEQYSALQAYVYSLPISKTFIAHDNGILLPGEKIIRKMSSSDVDILHAGGSGNMLTGNSTGQNVLGENTDITQSQGSLTSGDNDFFYTLPSWKSWVVYFGQKMGDGK